MVRILATSVAALCLTATAAVAQDGRDAFSDLCLANRDTVQVREAVVADGWVLTSEEVGARTHPLVGLTTEVWTKSSAGAAPPALFIAFGRVAGAEFGSPIPMDMCLVVAPGITAADAGARIEGVLGFAPNASTGGWMVSRNGRHFQAENELADASADVITEAAATRDVRMVAVLPGEGLAIYLQMIPVAGRD